MTTLKRQPDGSYRGAYKGHEVTVRKEEVSERITDHYVKTETHWIARSGTFEYRSRGNRATRDEAVQGLLRELDMAAISIPEVDALLKRWAEEIKAIVHMIDEKDITARMQLEGLSADLSSFDSMVRLHAVHFEEKLAKLKSRMQQATERPALEAMP
jgi:hypothetical protein